MQMKKKKFGFYVSGNATRLQQIIVNCPEIIQNTFIVVNDGDKNGALKDFFFSRKITYLEVNYLSVSKSSRNEFISNILLNNFQTHQIDYIFCFGARLLKGQILSVFKNRIINFHPSILPMHPGEKSIDKAIDAGSFLLGNTAHFIDEGVDSGPIIIQNVIKYDSSLSYDVILSQQVPMVLQIYRWLNQNRIKIVKNKVIIEGATSFSSFFPSLE
jgi:phosphoribosylglycinamide formyltransferase-1